MALPFLQKFAVKVIQWPSTKAHEFLASTLRKTPQFESKISEDLKFNIGYGHSPSQRALNNFTGLYKPATIEDTVYAAVNLANVAKLQLKLSEKDFYSHFVSTNVDGHSYNLTVNVPLNPGLAKNLIDDPQVLIELMAEFLNEGATFIYGDTAQEFIDELSEPRLASYADHIARIKKENSQIRQSTKLSEDIAAFLGGVDLVFIRNHRSGSYAGGIKDQSWVAGTSGYHGMCGQLTWRIIFDPKNPNVLTIQFYGDGQSYTSLVDSGNNEFASIGFPLMIEVFQYKMNNGLKGKSYDEVQAYIKKNNPQLANRIWWCKKMMPQRFGEFMNEIWRNPTQFTAEKVRAELKKSPSKALVIKVETSLITKSVQETTPVSETVAKQATTEEALLSGIYFEDKRFDSGTLQAIFTPEEQFPPKE